MREKQFVSPGEALLLVVLKGIFICSNVDVIVSLIPTLCVFAKAKENNFFKLKNVLPVNPKILGLCR
jgi:hypothetical protein